MLLFCLLVNGGLLAQQCKPRYILNFNSDIDVLASYNHSKLDADSWQKGYEPGGSLGVFWEPYFKNLGLTIGAKTTIGKYHTEVPMIVSYKPVHGMDVGLGLEVVFLSVDSAKKSDGTNLSGSGLGYIAKFDYQILRWFKLYCSYERTFTALNRANALGDWRWNEVSVGVKYFIEREDKWVVPDGPSAWYYRRHKGKIKEQIKQEGGK